MTPTEPLVIIGAGGHGRELLDILEAMNAHLPTYEVLGFVDDGVVDADVLARRGVPILGPIRRLEKIPARYLIGVGSPQARRQIAGLVSGMGRLAASAIHPSATLGSDIELGPGAVLAAGARITTNVRAGSHVHLNVNSTLSHDCRLGDYVMLNPGARVCGQVTLADEVVVGAGATVIEGVRIGRGTVIGAGAVVVCDLPAGVTAVGVPARPLPSESQIAK
jgi:sugar O-acyltransferase (sialic acid O-acetyltransferase NeuD family)